VKIDKSILALPPNRATTDTFQDNADFFGPPPLIPGEDEAAYRALKAKILGALRPEDFVQIIHVEDVTYQTWQIMRYQRLKDQFLRAVACQGLEDILAPFSEQYEIDDLSEAWERGERDAVKIVNKILKSRGLTIDAVIAKALELNLHSVAGFERLIWQADALRTSAFREIDRHRAALGAAVRAIIREAEDAESSEVDEEVRSAAE